ncbi:unnamed protein product [Rotaria magnacalcarata]|uniref:Fibronectin type III-like domain-containing protein n=4 Tax=Rotaria magnacalcarata TaxID=392030 RepID=A0A816V3F0_9BILA|nr:unnamed protein product [Rotaria magnacalcarata]
MPFYTEHQHFRDPRWGHGQETPGEDPFLTSQYVYTLIDGLQNGDDERYLKTAAVCKHYDAYDLEEWQGVDRHHFSAIVNDQDLVETYLPPFESCIRDAHAASIMCSYNMINGVPGCANRFLLQTIARDSYHLDGFVVSDGGAIPTTMNAANYTSTVQETVAVALHAGVDLESGTFYLQHAQEALDNKTIVESDINQALERTFNVLVRLGWFNPPEQQPYRRLNKDNVNTIDAQQLALLSAQESIVLLKNVNNALPLNMDRLIGKKLVLIGPTANATVLMQVNYYGKAPYLIDPITAFKSLIANRSIDIESVAGCQISGNNTSDFSSVIQLAQQADVVIFFGGINQLVEAESRDRNEITLPAIQLTLLQELEKVVRSPIHVVIMSGSGLDLSYIRDSTNFSSLIWMGYAGQAGGLAVATAIFGQYNPGGRLPITFYPASYVDAVSMFDMQMRPSKTNPGRTYKFFTGQAVYEFGTGLSYTEFAYSWGNDSSISSYKLRTLMRNTNDKRHVLVTRFRVNVTNTGSLAGDDVVLAFLEPPRTSIIDPTPPIKQLFGFQRVHLNVNESKEVYFSLYADSLLSIGHNGFKWLQPRLYKIIIGTKVMHTIKLQGTGALWSELGR